MTNSNRLVISILLSFFLFFSGCTAFGENYNKYYLLPQDENGPNQNLFETVESNNGSVTATSFAQILGIFGSDDINTFIDGNNLFIDFNGTISSIIDTNAETACEDGNFLDGSGNCIPGTFVQSSVFNASWPVDWDTNIANRPHIPTEAEIDANALEVINSLDLNNSLDYAKQDTNAQTACSDENVLLGDGNCAGFSLKGIGLQGGWNGDFLETIKFAIDSNGTVITGSLERDGGGDLTMNFSDGFTILDTTPAATITLIPGTDSNPQKNFIYIPIATKILTVSSSDWPTVEHIKVDTAVLRTAATTQPDGALGNRNWNDHVEGTNQQGHIMHIGQRIRQEAAKWDSGVEGSVAIDSGPSPDDVFVAVTSGKVYQLHLQSFPVIDMNLGNDIHVVNDFSDPYETINNLNSETTDASGNTLVNKHFSFVVWGIQNETDQNSHLMLNLPTNSYNSSAGAIADPSNFSVYDIPKLFQGTGFLIARFTFNLSASGGGTWTLNDTQDLRGFLPNTSAGVGGGGGGGITTFLGLIDTPNAYTGQALKTVQVNSGESALEFINQVVDTNVWTEGWLNDDNSFTQDLNANLNALVDVAFIDFNLTETEPHQEGRLNWNDEDKTLEIHTNVVGTKLQIGQEMYLFATNKTGEDLNNGQVVFINGAQGQRPTIQLANATDDNTSRSTLGILTQDIENNQTGFVTTFGKVRDLNTTTFGIGEMLYLATTDGDITNIAPPSPNHLVELGIAISINDSNGEIFVRIKNGFETTDLHDVNETPATISGQILVWDEDFNFYKVGDYNNILGRVVDSNDQTAGYRNSLGNFITDQNFGNNTGFDFDDINSNRFCVRGTNECVSDWNDLNETQNLFNNVTTDDTVTYTALTPTDFLNFAGAGNILTSQVSTPTGTEVIITGTDTNIPKNTEDGNGDGQFLLWNTITSFWEHSDLNQIAFSSPDEKLYIGQFGLPFVSLDLGIVINAANSLTGNGILQILSSITGTSTILLGDDTGVGSSIVHDNITDDLTFTSLSSTVFNPINDFNVNTLIGNGQFFSQTTADVSRPQPVTYFNISSTGQGLETFGGELVFTQSDTEITNQVLGAIQWEEFDTNDTGKIIISPARDGVLTPQMEIDSKFQKVWLRTGQQVHVQNVIFDRNMNPDDYYFSVATLFGSIDLNLPKAGLGRLEVQTGHVFHVKDGTGNAGLNNIRITSPSGDLIDGAVTHTISVNYGSVSLIKTIQGWETF